MSDEARESYGQVDRRDDGLKWGAVVTGKVVPSPGHIRNTSLAARSLTVQTRA